MSIKSVCIELSNQCPLRCLHCSTNALPSKHLFFGKEETERLVQTFIAQKIETVYLSGGEPLLSPYLCDMVNGLSAANIKTAIYSSGVIFGSNSLSSVDSSYCKSLKFAGLDAIAFSIYSMNEEIHDKITNTTGSLRLLQGSIANFINVDMAVEINFVPFSNNYLELENIIDFCIKNSIKTLNIQKPIPQGRLKNNSHLILTDLEESIFVNTLTELANRYKKEISIVVSKLFGIKNATFNTSLYTAGFDEMYIAIPYQELDGRKYRYLAE